jgi:predicted Zn-dependent protease
MRNQTQTSERPQPGARHPARHLLALLCLLAALLPGVPAGAAGKAAAAQSLPQIVERGCGAPEITKGPERAELNHIVQRLSPVIKADGKHVVYVALLRSNSINSWEVSVDATHYLVCIPQVMVRFMGDAEGELAFVVSHEIGHALDDLCRTANGRLSVAKSQGSIAAALGELLGGARGAYELSGLAQEKGCEERADEIGFLIFTRAGYNPFDAAGAFGRLEMYSGDTGGVLNQVRALSSGHPMTSDRISHMRELLLRDLKESRRGR